MGTPLVGGIGGIMNIPPPPFDQTPKTNTKPKVSRS